MYKLIIIDDEYSFLESISTLFDWKLMGFELSATFTDSQKALQYINNHHVDAVITDIKMPKLTGVELAKICHEKYPKIKIAFLTAYSDFEYAKSAIKYNVTSYILKATSYSELSSSIEEFLVSVLPDVTNDVEINPININKFKTQQIFTNLLLGIIHSKEELQSQLIEAELTDIDLTQPCALLTFILENFNDFLNRWHHSRELIYQAIEQMFLIDGSTLSFFVTKYAHDKLEFIVFCKEKCNFFQENLDEMLTMFYNNAASIFNLSIRLLEIKTYNSVDQLLCKKETTFLNTAVNPDTIVSKAQKYIEQNYHRNISLNDIASYVGLSPTYFSVYYKKITQSNYNEDLNAFRIEKAKELLKSPDIKASHVFSMVGYQSYTYFYKIFKKYTGQTPANYQKNFFE